MLRQFEVQCARAQPSALVVVGGQPIYGDEKLLEQLLPNAELHKITVCGADKVVDLTETVAKAKGWKLVEIKDHLKKALEVLGTSLAEIECD